MRELQVADTLARNAGNTFADYQVAVNGMVCYDDPNTRATVKGIPADSHLLRGLFEEYAETLEFDAPAPAYSRIGMVALSASHPLLAVYRQQSAEVDNHRKEFGDLLWYMTAALGRCGFSLDEVLGGGESMQLGLDTSPLEPYRYAFRNFSRSMAACMDDPLCLRRRTRTATSARTLLEVVSGITQHRLGMPLAGIAEGNLRKLADRQRRGIVFGSGDTR